MKKNNCAFYLKINRLEGYTVRNLRHWLETVKEYKGKVDCYILCDSDLLKEKVVSELNSSFPKIEELFMTSIITKETTEIIDRVTDERWKMAGYAHISTFFHACEYGYECFWNIDADDTRFCLNPSRCHELLDSVEAYAKRENIDCFSLDMHTSRISSGRHWSFGVTYVNNHVKWIQLMKRASKCDISTEDQWPNIDRFFRYIRNHFAEVKIESYYFENLKFLHYSNDFFWRLNVSALYHWKEGILLFPILFYCVGLNNEKARMKIDAIVHKLDIGISDQETLISMINACNSPSYFGVN